MQTPPPFVPPPPPRRKSNAALILTIIFVCVLVPCGGLIGFIWWGKVAFYDKQIAPFVTCGITFEELQKAIHAYAKDHKNTLPKAEQWQDQVKTYYARRLLQDKSKFGPFGGGGPSEGILSCGPVGSSPKTGIAFNTAVSEKNLDKIKAPESTVLLFEVATPAMNAHDLYKDKGKSAPPFMGEPREWLHVPVTGPMKGMKIGRSGKRSDITWTDDESDSSDSSSDTKSGSDAKPSDNTDSSSDAGSDGTTTDASPKSKAAKPPKPAAK